MEIVFDPIIRRLPLRNPNLSAALFLSLILSIGVTTPHAAAGEEFGHLPVATVARDRTAPSTSHAARARSDRELAGTYRITDLGDFGGGSANAFGLNSRNEVAGIAETAQGGLLAFLYRGSKLEALPGLLPGYDHGRADGVNRNAEVVGNTAVRAQPPFTGVEWHAFYWSEETGSIDLTAGEGGPSWALAITDSGVIVGGDYRGPALWRVNRDRTVSMERIGDSAKTANDINERGLVAGYDPFQGAAWIYDSVTRDSEFLPGRFSYAYGVNDRDQVVGHLLEGSTPPFSPAVRWDKVTQNGRTAWRITELPMLPEPYNACFAKAINNSGLIVGECVAQGVVFPGSAFAYIDGVTLPLTDLLNGEDAALWTLHAAFQVNDAGAIVGIGERNGAARGFLMQPVVPRTRAVRR
jgi:uncharacterized membrane protein